MDLHLVVGLGNPGTAYAPTRHNVGFRCLDVVAKRHGVEITKRQAGARVGIGKVDGCSVLLAKPQTYINRSGAAVVGLMRAYGLDMGRIIVINDDMDLPIGKIRVRERGSAGGHRGVQSIIEALHTNEFIRVRVGIGRPADQDTIEYVLGAVPKEMDDELASICARVADAVECVLTEGVSVAMNKFNRD